MAFKEFKKSRGSKSLWSAIKHSKNPTIFTVLLEDTAAMTGLLVAFIGIHLADTLNLPTLDGLVSIIIGIILASLALILSIECNGLLIGESASQEVEFAISELEQKIKTKFSHVKRLFIEAQSVSGHRRDLSQH